MINKKVPLAILSCFVIAFIIQGILKLSGIFIFEKTLDWDIFNIIDNNIILNIVFNTIICFISVYCLSLTLTTKAYSNRWYHYIVIGLSSIGMVTLKTLIQPNIQYQIIIDVYLYILVPFIINLTTDNKYKLFTNKSFIIVLTLQILLYFCYLGLCYWSGLLNSLILATQIKLTSMGNFLVFLEVYIGLFAIMLSSNILLSKIKKEN